jgi:hypothetical protein
MSSGVRSRGKKIRDALISVSARTSLTVLFWLMSGWGPSPATPKIGRSLSKVPETEEMADRRNWCLKSRARVSDGLARRFFVVRRKNLRR